MKLTTSQKLVMGIGVLAGSMMVATMIWLQRPISADVTRGGGPDSEAATSMARKRSASGEERVRADSVPSSFNGLREERVVTEREPAAAVRDPRSPRDAALLARSSNPPSAGFKISQSSEGLDIVLDDRASVPAVLALGAGGVSSQGAQSRNPAVVSHIADRILEEFVGSVAGGHGSDPTAPTNLSSRPSLERWEDAASRANERYRALLGEAEFMAATRRAAKQFGQKKPQ